MRAIKKVYIIAEAGVNHNGSLARAKEMVRVAAEAGADAVKFQTFRADYLVSKSAPKADYQLQTTDQDESQYEMLKKLELNLATHQELMKECQKNNIEFMSTPFDSASLKMLIDDCGLEKIKIPSGEITNAPFLLEVAQTNKPVILSTGMSTLGEIESALGVLAFGYLQRQEHPSLAAFQQSFIAAAGQAILRQKITLLHCTTDYPALADTVNLQCIATMQAAFGLPVGYSDHTDGIAVSIAAVACGACLIEKHFTLDKNLSGPDHKASLEPNELKAMIRGIRQVEQALGNGIKMPVEAELKNRKIVRKSIVAAVAIEANDAFTAKNLQAKRPGDGLSPLHYWELLGTMADCTYEKDEKVKL